MSGDSGVLHGVEQIAQRVRKTVRASLSIAPSTASKPVGVAAANSRSARLITFAQSLEPRSAADAMQRSTVKYSMRRASVGERYKNLEEDCVMGRGVGLGEGASVRASRRAFMAATYTGSKILNTVTPTSPRHFCYRRVSDEAHIAVERRDVADHGYPNETTVFRPRSED